jgi:hypothetical protein
MLSEGGYVHSLKTLLEKSRAEEKELAERCAHTNRFQIAQRIRVTDWLARLWKQSRSTLQ